MDRLTRALLRILPASWRATVEQDLDDDARSKRRGAGWRFWEAARIVATWRWTFGLEAMSTDLKHAVRSLAFTPWFTAGAIFTFALGIGANVAVFSMIDKMLFRPLPYAKPADVVMLFPVNPTGTIYTRTPRPLAVYAKAQAGLFSDLASVGQTQAYRVPRASDDDPGVRLTEATFNLLSLLGSHPAVGRDFTRADAISHAKVALIRHEVWQRRYGARDDVIGQRLGKDGSIEIVGVLPAGFVAPTAFWYFSSDGLLLDPDLIDHSSATDGIWPVVARLAPGMTLASAQAAVEVLCARVAAETQRPGEAPLHVLVETAQAALFHGYRVYLWLVASAGAIVLLVACANLSSLLLARGRAREHIAALKTALGASVGRQIIGGLIECGLVVLAGTAVAMAVLVGVGDMLMSLEPGELHQYAVAPTDVRVLAIMLGVVATCVVVAAALPAWRAARVDVNAALQLGSRTGRRTRSVGARGLLAAEAALGVVLVSGAVFTARSLVGILNRDLGYVPANLFVITGSLLPRQDPVDARLASYRQALEALSQDPAVTAVGGIDTFTIGQNTGVRGFPPVVSAQGPRSESYLYQVTSGYFEAVGAKLLAGRPISSDDEARHARVAVINEAAIPLLFPGERAETVVGRTFRVPNEDDRSVVGVIATHRATLMRPPIAAAFVPYGQADPKLGAWAGVMDIVVRARPGTSPNLGSLRGRLKALYPQASFGMRDAGSLLEPAVARPKLQSYLFASFALIALVLAGGGLYAVASFDVALRRYEMGLRMALGASPARMKRLVIATSLAPVAVGAAAGLLVSWWAGQFLQNLLVEGQARDPWLLMLSAAILLGAAVVAAWIPARRAAATDPATVLRAQ